MSVRRHLCDGNYGGDLAQYQSEVRRRFWLSRYQLPLQHNQDLSTVRSSRVVMPHCLRRR
ncbi:MAG: hypothetical protein LVS60_05895 [Nodosilinea sp. LVE1205-7]